MAYLDVSEALTDPMLNDRFDVLRRGETVTDKGRSSTTPMTFPGVVGVVAAAHGNDLDRLDDQQRMARNLTIVTKFRLRGPSPNFQPDQVLWKGDTFTVIAVDPYPQYGRGFVQAIVSSVDAIDQPTPEEA